MAQVVNTPLEATIATMESNLGFSVDSCDWQVSKSVKPGPLCLGGNLHHNCSKHLCTPRICCVCWSDFPHRRALLSAVVESRKLKVVEKVTVV
uniref:Uncharacterized protein n=1 Tax=Bird gammacoronavirus AnasCN24 TaxID=3237959 RepID=A0AB39AES1_9GAMC